MKHKKPVLISSCLTLLFLLILFHNSVFGAIGKAISVGQTLPEFKLDVPGLDAEKKYLGLENDDPFTLAQLPGKLVLVEIFSTTCGTCIKSAPGMNKLFKLIQNDPELKKDLKMMAIGQGDSAKKVGLWRKKFRVKFPLFPDRKREVFKKFGTPGTPYTVLINKSGMVLYAHGGEIKNIEEFIGELKEFNKQQ